MDIRLNNAETIIFLDIPRIICAFRVIKRRFQFRNKTRPDMGEGCEERISFEFLKWVWQYPKIKKPLIMKKLESFSREKEVIILTSPREVERFLKKIKGPV